MWTFDLFGNYRTWMFNGKLSNKTIRQNVNGGRFMICTFDSTIYFNSLEEAKEYAETL